MHFTKARLDQIIAFQGSPATFYSLRLYYTALHWEEKCGLKCTALNPAILYCTELQNAEFPLSGKLLINLVLVWLKVLENWREVAGIETKGNHPEKNKLEFQHWGGGVGEKGVWGVNESLAMSKL